MRVLDKSMLLAKQLHYLSSDFIGKIIDNDNSSWKWTEDLFDLIEYYVQYNRALLFH